MTILQALKVLELEVPKIEGQLKVIDDKIAILAIREDQFSIKLENSSNLRLSPRTFLSLPLLSGVLSNPPGE